MLFLKQDTIVIMYKLLYAFILVITARKYKVDSTTAIQSFIPNGYRKRANISKFPKSFNRGPCEQLITFNNFFNITFPFSKKKNTQQIESQYKR